LLAATPSIWPVRGWITSGFGSRHLSRINSEDNAEFHCGIDIATKEELIAVNHSVDEIAKLIGADRLFYGDLKDAFDSCITGNPKIKDMDMSCFDGRYVTGGVDEELLKKQAEARACERLASGEDDFGDIPGEGQLNLL